MKKHFDYYTILVVILYIIVILAFAAMMANAIRATASDTEVHGIMAEAQEHIDRYDTALAPAVEMPVVFPVEPVEVEEPVEDWYIESIPLSKEMQKAVFDAACEFGVDYFLAIGVISMESNFQNITGDGGDSIGYFQIQPRWWGDLMDEIGVDDLSDPVQNFRTGCAILSYLIERYQGDVSAALTVYNAGYDTGGREYASAVLSAADDIMRQAGVVFL